MIMLLETLPEVTVTVASSRSTSSSFAAAVIVIFPASFDTTHHVLFDETLHSEPPVFTVISSVPPPGLKEINSVDNSIFTLSSPSYSSRSIGESFSQPKSANKIIRNKYVLYFFIVRKFKKQQ